MVRLFFAGVKANSVGSTLLEERIIEKSTETNKDVDKQYGSDKRSDQK
jgi:hypothetical protein